MIRLSDTVQLPYSVATGVTAILGVRGSGKTYTTAVVVEELLTAGLPVIVIDSMGIWHGLTRSALLGIPIFNIHVLGGAYSGTKLDPGQGTAVARAAVDTNLSMILCLSEMTRTEQRGFVADFANELYLYKSAPERHTPVHVVIEECDQFIPQRMDKDKAPCFEAVDALARRGRSRGIGLSLISQRPAVVNKDCVSQADCLIALRLTMTHDRKAVKEWMASNGQDSKAFLDSLPSLPTGEAWVWYPTGGVFARTRVRTRLTADTSKTPEFKPTH